MKAGSSPLARGLLGDRGDLFDDRGIIPARAGFTVYGRVNAKGQADHPRSRGVYEGGLRSMRGRCGSSPLARGLPECRRRPRPPQGIIPARAGFTGRSSRAGCRAPDHPRSRGVYIGPESPGEALTGSSPLARGLLCEELAAEQGVGIIPARAGFTPGPAGRPGPVRDHPRSRGVYARRRRQT